MILVVRIKHHVWTPKQRQTAHLLSVIQDRITASRALNS
jgi:hypothetical protein